MPTMLPAVLDVIWIAPKVPGYADLGWLEELGTITDIEGVRVIPLTGNVTRSQVARVLKQHVHIVIFSGHGGGGTGNEHDPDYGLKLTDGTTIKPEWFATYVSNCRPMVCVIAACSSQIKDSQQLSSMASKMCQAGVNVIGFPAETGDAAAAIFTKEFVGAMSANAKLKDAFAVAMESIANSETAKGVYLTPGLIDISLDTALRLEKIDSELAEILALLNIHSSNAKPRDTSGIGITALREDKTGDNIRAMTRGTKKNIRGIHYGDIKG